MMNNFNLLNTPQPDLPNGNWEEIKSVYKSKLDPQKVYIRQVITKYETYKLGISIGVEVTHAMDWKSENRIKVLTDKLNPVQLLLKKSTNDYEGYKLNYAEGSRALTFAIQLKTPLDIEMNVTHSIFFQKNYGCLLIDMSAIYKGNEK